MHLITVCYSPDGKLLAGASDNGGIYVWNAADGEGVASHLAEKEEPNAPWAFSPDGKTLAVASWPDSIRLLEVVTGCERWNLRVRP